MDQWCMWLLGILAVPAQTANAVISWLLDKIPRLKDWFSRQPAIVKLGVYGIVTAGIGYGAYSAAAAMACADLPEQAGYLYTLFMAVLGLFIGGKRHEADKRKEAEAEIEALRAEVARLTKLLEYKE